MGKATTWAGLGVLLLAGGTAACHAVFPFRAGPQAHNDGAATRDDRGRLDGGGPGDAGHDAARNDGRAVDGSAVDGRAIDGGSCGSVVFQWRDPGQANASCVTGQAPLGGGVACAADIAVRQAMFDSANSGWVAQCVAGTTSAAVSCVDTPLAWVGGPLAGSASRDAFSSSCAPGLALLGGGCTCAQGELTASYPDTANRRWFCGCTTEDTGHRAIAACGRLDCLSWSDVSTGVITNTSSQTFTFTHRAPCPGRVVGGGCRVIALPSSPPTAVRLTRSRVDAQGQNWECGVVTQGPFSVALVAFALCAP